MKDVVSLTFSGKTLGFPIQSGFLEELGLKRGNWVEVEIFIPYQGKSSFIITRRLKPIGSSLGVTIRKYIVDELELSKGTNFQIDVRKPKTPSV
ncbi:MAG: hypothetical protein ACFFCE_01665 [Promethearchaeota archaeon]